MFLGNVGLRFSPLCCVFLNKYVNRSLIYTPDMENKTPTRYLIRFAPVFWFIILTLTKPTIFLKSPKPLVMVLSNSKDGDRIQGYPNHAYSSMTLQNTNLTYNLTHANGDASLSLVIVHTKIRCSLWISLMAEREHGRCNEEVLMTEYNSVACRGSNISSTISFFHSFCSASKVWMDLMSSSVWLFGLLMLASKQHRWIIQRFTFTQVNMVSNIIYLIHQHLKIVSHPDGGQVPLL